MSTFTQSVQGRSIVDIVALGYLGGENKTPDQAGLDFWAAQINSGNVSIQQFMDGIANSSQFATIHAGETRAQIITDLYVNVLGRQPDAAGLAFYEANGTYGQILSSIVLSPEALSVNANYVQKFELLASTGTVDSVSHLDNATVTPPPVTTTVTVPGPTVFVPTPTAEAHDVVVADHAQASAAFLNADGTLVFSHGSPSNDMSQVTDRTSGFEIDVDVHERQLATNYSPATSTAPDANGIVHETFNVIGGTQNNSAGVNPARSDASIDFTIGGAPNALLNPDYSIQFHTTGPGGFFTNGHVTVAANGAQAWIVDSSSNAALVGQSVIGDDPASTTYASNSANLAFAEFGGVANAHGTYSFEVDVVKVTGLSAGTVVAGYHADITASAAVA